MCIKYVLVAITTWELVCKLYLFHFMAVWNFFLTARAFVIGAFARCGSPLNGDTYMAGRFVSRCGRWFVSSWVQGRKRIGPMLSFVVLWIPANCVLNTMVKSVSGITIRVDVHMKQKVLVKDLVWYLVLSMWNNIGCWYSNVISCRVWVCSTNSRWMNEAN